MRQKAASATMTCPLWADSDSLPLQNFVLRSDHAQMVFDQNLEITEVIGPMIYALC
ncbi:MAG: hypothetical protein ACX93O_03870 [Flagellimonas sp.]